ncbi:hypothetical protein L3Q82_006870 [Scortum barcoo]|uniref:Uncharacterized protein n=1 Tax=Scortum barcoo TaxID=214431 RepID=A0ACB8WW44_9TELE|nr:hypothetical protein L3Q82_006870 [Scortum barcoo]
MFDPSEQNAHHVSYKRFRRRIIQRCSIEGPAASTPLTTGGRFEPSFELDTVCQRLELDSPPRLRQSAQGVLQEDLRGSDERRHGLQPFTVLDEASVSLQGKSVIKLAAPLLVNDYYTNLLDCSCSGMVALALGSSVYLWNSETRALVGHLKPSPQPGRPSEGQAQSVSSLCWSRDGRTLCIGTRQGELQLWDVERQQSVGCLPSHLSVVRALSWQQQLLSSGSVLGRIHHFDPRAPTPLVGAVVQEDGICSLQWSPGDDRLASGSTEGLLCMWDGDVAGLKRSRQPVATMKQPSAVKAMGWCPWQRKMIATGGGCKDGELRIWDTESQTCVTSADTNSQICSLRWAEKKRYLVTGHGLPLHQVTCWTWKSLSLSPTYQLTVVYSALAVAQIMSPIQRRMSWLQAQEFCQRHYVDLAVLSTEEQYISLLNATAANKASFWLGLQRQNISGRWKWVDGEELSYENWYRKNQEGCASLEAMLEENKKLLARRCEELHMFFCQGPVSPQPVLVNSVGSDNVRLSWNVSAFMQMTPHSYNVTICSNTCNVHIYSYTKGSALMNVNISNLTGATDYFMEISALVVRPDGVTGGQSFLQSTPTALQIKTVDSGAQYKVIAIIFKSLKLLILAPLLWMIYSILEKHKSPFLRDVMDSNRDISPVVLSIEDILIDLIPQKTRGVGDGSEIINGKQVQPHSLPFMALLENKVPACGGILIHPSWVLTAAHCAVHAKNVLLGVHSIKAQEKDSRQVRKVKTQVPHPCYDKEENVNDLMLLKLDKPVKETKTVKILPLRDTVKEPAGGSQCLVAGWGKTKNTANQMSDVLMAVNVTVIDRVKCNSAEYYGLTTVITRSMICAGSDGSNSADTCQGDSGGPLLCNGVLVGVTSFGKRCGLITKPGVYAFLSKKQLTWIKKTMKKSEI